jgi:hypothetical protein
VEKRYNHAFRFAEIEHSLGISGTYYFRLYSNHENGTIIKKIAKSGHEIGYHYDDLTYYKGDHDKAIKRFSKNLEYLRKIASVNTICMEGAPLSKYDNRNLWGKYNYRDYGIIGEPYFDIDFREIAYYTDTGRRWDGEDVSVRDKVNRENKQNDEDLDQVTENKFPKFRTTYDMIRAIERGQFPDKAMLTIHPQRWHDRPLPWIKELIWQNVKNQVKRLILKARG